MAAGGGGGDDEYGLEESFDTSAGAGGGGVKDVGCLSGHSLHKSSAMRCIKAPECRPDLMTHHRVAVFRCAACVRWNDHRKAHQSHMAVLPEATGQYAVPTTV